jgi:isoleucyl-tRNA synthetase
VSAVRLLPGSGDGETRAGVTRAEGTKCERCWRIVPEVSASADRNGLCPRCVEALAEAVSL